jgi:uncharacterized protein
LVDPDQIELPSYAHLPRKNERHAEGFLDHVIALAPHITTSGEADKNTPWLFGVRLFKSDFFWEAHEVWEAVWLKAAPNSREQHFMQGMIHLTNALLKLKLGQQKAAVRITLKADESLERAFQGGADKPVMGVSFVYVNELLMQIMKNEI